MAKGLVSTIIPVYNRSGLLKEAVASVLAQTYRPIEIIIIDDGSTDETEKDADEIAAEYPNEIKVIHQLNSGPGLAREAGRLSASGEFIQYLDSDDLLMPRKFEWQVSGLKAHPDCGVAYGRTKHYRQGDRPVEVSWKRTGEIIDFMFPSFLMSRWWGTSTPLYRKTVTDLAGPWTSLINEEDWEYDCRIAAQGIRLYYIAEFVSDQRDHGGERLSRDGVTNKTKLKHRAIAHSLILQHARNAGIGSEIPEMQHFARELFLLSRQCGAAGLLEESRRLFELAREASGAIRGNGLDFRIYKYLSETFGWGAMGRLSCYADRLRR
jgi:glycosyltransferase involved in cell wall biosynthesis